MRRGTRFPRPAALAAAALLACACASAPPPAFPGPAPAPPIGEVERVVFLLGDAGEARAATSPLLARLRADVEETALRLARDSAVAVFVLGDNVYPTGLHPPGSPEFDGDTAVLMDQVRLVGGPVALRRGAVAYFLAGNHDWGLKSERDGLDRVRNQAALFDAARARTGAQVRMEPEPGTGGPFVLDWGPSARFLLLDTAWWLVASDAAGRKRTLAGIDAALATAGDREVFLVSHHPFRSSGSHGGNISFWRTLGAQWLLSKSGALVQNLNSAPYQELERGLRAIYATRGRPLAHLAGHEHVLEVLDALDDTDPYFSVVSGSGSKSMQLGRTPGMRFGAATPGYMRLILERGGGIVLAVESTPAEYLTCPSDEPDRSRCMREGVDAFRTVYWQRLK